MRLNQKQLNNLPVYTESEDHLGDIINFELDTQTQQIINFHVGSSSFLKQLLKEEGLIIGINNIVSLSEEKMIVKDAVIKEENISPEKLLSKTAVPTLQKELD